MTLQVHHPVAVPRGPVMPDAERLDHARQVLRAEAAALEAVAGRLGDAGIIVAGIVQFEAGPNAPTNELIYYNDEDERLAKAIKSEVDQRLADPITIVKGELGVGKMRVTIKVIDALGVKG